MKLSQRAREAQPFHALAIGERATAIEAAGHDVVRLSIGEPDFGAPPAVLEAMRDAMDGRPLPYTAPLGLPALRRAIANFYAEHHGVEVDPSRIAVTSGASSALLLVTASTTDPGDEVLLADPSYPCNRAMVRAFGGTVVEVPTSAAARYQLDLRAVRLAWSSRTNAVMIASPSNPTGTSIPDATLQQICDFAASRGAWRIVDEIYLDLADRRPDGSRAPSVLSVDPDAIAIGSFSKYFGMTGWRLGWCVLPEALVEPFERLAMHFFLSASAPAQLAALACFEPSSLALSEERRLALLTRRRIVIDGLAAIGLDVPVVPDGAFYVYVDVTSTGLDAWTFCERALDEAHVALTPGRDFGESTAMTHIRLSYAASEASLRQGLQRLSAFVSSLGDALPR